VRDLRPSSLDEELDDLQFLGLEDVGAVDGDLFCCCVCVCVCVFVRESE